MTSLRFTIRCDRRRPRCAARVESGPVADRLLVLNGDLGSIAQLECDRRALERTLPHDGLVLDNDSGFHRACRYAAMRQTAMTKVMARQDHAGPQRLAPDGRTSRRISRMKQVQKVAAPSSAIRSASRRQRPFPGRAERRSLPVTFSRTNLRLKRRLDRGAPSVAPANTRRWLAHAGRLCTRRYPGCSKERPKADRLPAIAGRRRRLLRTCFEV